MKIVFFGNSKYSAIGEKIIFEKLGIYLVVTLPDTLDKKKNPVSNSVKSFAQQNSIPIIETTKLTTEIISQIAETKLDFIVVQDYGLILPQRLLDIPKYAPLNIHHSLLPKYRGPSPAPSAILAGDRIAGVTIIHMIDKVDAGDIYAQKEYTLKPGETTESLLAKLNTLGGHLVVDVINAIVAKKFVRRKQVELEATYTHHMEKTDGYIDLNNPPTFEILYRMIRAYYPWPDVWTYMDINNQRKIIKFLPEDKLQVEGKKPMSRKDFYNGYPYLKQQLENLFGPLPQIES